MNRLACDRVHRRGAGPQSPAPQSLQQFLFNSSDDNHHAVPRLSVCGGGGLVEVTLRHLSGILDLPLTADFASTWRFMDALGTAHHPEPDSVAAVVAETAAVARL